MSTETQTKSKKEEKTADDLMPLFNVGAHYTHTKSKRHPSAKPFIFGMKNKIEIFDLEKTDEMLNESLDVMEEYGRKGKKILFVSSKMEALESIKKAADSIEMPYVAGRWIGGTLTNHNEIKKRLERLVEIEAQQDKGELSKYTKKERLMIDREREKLESRFSGLRRLNSMPDLVFIVDVGKEKIAFNEILTLNIPIMSLSGSDCDFSKITYSIPANDSSKASINYFVSVLADAYKKGQSEGEREVKKTE